MPTGSPIAVIETVSPTGRPTPVETTADGPPTAVLAAEGGDPITGQLGTYAWGDGGSDSPWLHGAPISVGAAEPLTVTLEPDESIASWSARSVPASADGPAGGTSLGQGTGRPQFAAPRPGEWTVEVHVVFADGAGNASYFWKLTVR